VKGEVGGVTAGMGEGPRAHHGSRGDEVSGDTAGLKVGKNSYVHPSATIEGTVTIGDWSWVAAGAMLKGDITIGDGTYIGERSILAGEIGVGSHTRIQIGVVIRGKNTIGDHVNIYDLVNIEGGRPWGYHDSKDESIIGDRGWVNHGATMHGSQIGKEAAVGINTALDYNTVVGRGAIVTNGSATSANTVIPENSIAQGVPARVIKENITDQDRIELMGLVPAEWVMVEADGIMSFVRSQLEAMGRLEE
jgi:carbonic anhydrase/acetyltransferase-like protein (isoleucine patch superfamily)